MKGFLAGSGRRFLLVPQAAGGEQGTEFPRAHSVMGPLNQGCLDVGPLLGNYCFNLETLPFPPGPVLTLPAHPAASALLVPWSLRKCEF